MTHEEGNTVLELLDAQRVRMDRAYEVAFQDNVRHTQKEFSNKREEIRELTEKNMSLSMQIDRLQSELLKFELKQIEYDSV